MDLKHLEHHCLEKQAGRRYATIAAFDADLRAWLDGAPVSLRSGQGYRTALWLRRHVYAVSVATAVVLLLVSALIVSLNQAERARAAAAQ